MAPLTLFVASLVFAPLRAPPSAHVKPAAILRAPAASMGLRAFVRRRILRRPRILLYVDPTDADVYDRRVQLTAGACAAYGTQLVCVWSGSASVACYSIVQTRTADAPAAELAASAPEVGDELAWAAEHLPAGCEVVGVISGSARRGHLRAAARRARRARPHALFACEARRVPSTRARGAQGGEGSSPHGSASRANGPSRRVELATPLQR